MELNIKTPSPSFVYPLSKDMSREPWEHSRQFDIGDVVDLEDRR